MGHLKTLPMQQVHIIQMMEFLASMLCYYIHFVADQITEQTSHCSYTTERVKKSYILSTKQTQKQQFFFVAKNGQNIFPPKTSGLQSMQIVFTVISPPIRSIFATHVLFFQLTYEFCHFWDQQLQTLVFNEQFCIVCVCVCVTYKTMH